MSTNASLVDRLLAHGYIPIPTRGKAWIHDYMGVPLHRIDSAPDFDIIQSAFKAHPEAGVSVTAPFIAGSKLKLVIIDVDIYDPELAKQIIERVSRIIGQPCPFKIGQKGGTFFLVAHEEIDLKLLFKNLRGVNASWLAKGKVWGPTSLTVLGRKQGIDIIGAGSYHSVLPPSIHPDTGKPYEWRSFPGTNVILTLEDTPPNKLPIFTRAMQFLLTMVFQPGTDKIWDFIGATSPGDFNQRMIEGTLTMHNEGMSKDDILEVSLREARRDSPSNIKQREAEIHGAVNPLETKFKERKPASSRKRVPPDREQADWMLAQLEMDKCALFNGRPHLWTGERWQNLGDLKDWYIKIFEAFPAANHSSIESALKLAEGAMPVRIPQDSPDLIPCANGVIHVPTMTLKREEQDDNFVGHVPHPYDSTALCPAWDMYIRDFLLPPDSVGPEPGDHEKAINLLEEYLGYSLVRSHKFQKFLMLIGASGTGKSTLTFILKGLIPPEWITEVPLEGFSQENLVLTMANSHINISSEAGRVFFTKGIDNAVLRITTGESMVLWSMHRNRTVAPIPSRLIINGNLVPSFNSPEGAIERRMLFLRTTDIKPLPEILNFHEHILREAPGIFYKLVLAYKRLMERGHFLLPSYSIREAEETTKGANSVTLWFHSTVTVLEDSKQPVLNQDLYDHYRMWCDNNGHKPFSSNEWGKMLTAMGHRSINVRIKIGGEVHIQKGRRLATARPSRPREDS